MEKLTSERRNGIKTGYWSPKTKEEVVQKLGAIEHQAESLINRACDHICRFPDEADSDELPGICEECPVNKLAELIGV